ncbi:hypothetical protein KI387_016137 [Taxus chinensis]|uniref:Carboxypeptidase n=1 Tax=Taxus chinensis TaxID=29808 RepID=A0AA38LE21_TAXCH|nr:hypothetical protein KI387_016137 [Taxus chinensis]
MLVAALVFLSLLLPSNQLLTQHDALRSIRRVARSNAFRSIQWSKEPFPFRYDSDYLTEPKDVLKERKADRIIEGLPGQPDGSKFSQYSGYITVNASTQRSLFYYFAEATHNCSSKPLLLWLNGAEDNYAFLVNWFKRFAQYRFRDFYIAGESYAGSYVPELAATILEHKKKSQASFMNFKGVMVGNSDMSIVSDDIGEYVYAWSHALISDETYEQLMRHCSNISFIHLNNEQCVSLQNKMYAEMGNIDTYAIYDSTCPKASSTKSLSRQGNAYQYDPCIDNYVLKYMNRLDVQKAFHSLVYQSFSFSSLEELCQHSFANLSPTHLSGIKNSNIQVGGYSVIYKGNFTFATVREAGHEVPLHQPLRSFTLLRYFLAGQPLPRQQRRS